MARQFAPHSGYILLIFATTIEGILAIERWEKSDYQVK